MNQVLVAELTHESQNTRKMLERVPAAKWTWKPHDRSMELIRLCAHIANLPYWVVMTIGQDELDLAQSFPTFNPETTDDLVKRFDENLEKAMQSLSDVSDETLMKTWTLRKGDHVILSMPKAAVLRSMCFNHLVHHRGQLSVYLRLLDVPVPGMYGPSADDMIAAAAASN